MVPVGGRGPVWWQHGRWLLGPLLGFGLFAWAGFLYIGVRAQRRTWKVAAGFYGLGAGVAAGLLATAPAAAEPTVGETDPAGAARQATVAGLLLLAMWVGGAVHALLANREWLAWVRAHTPSPPPPGAPPHPRRSSGTGPSVAGGPGPGPGPGSGSAVVGDPGPGPGSGSAVAGGPGPDSGSAVAGMEEPWAAYVRSAESLGSRFMAAAGRVAAGPFQGPLRGLTEQVERSVEQSRQLAGHGQVLVTARRAIDVAAVDAGLAAARHALRADRTDSADHERQIVEALEAQRTAADRMDEVIDDVAGRLRLIEARLGEALARVVELPVHARAPGEPPPGTAADIDLLVSDLEALRQALDEVATPTRPGQRAGS
jgi:hypothetical protein